MNLSHLPVSIIGTGHIVPSREIFSSDIDIRLSLPVGHVERVSGVNKRYFTEAADTAASMGAKAAVLALQSANMELSEIDCVVAASATMDQGLPSNAALIHYELGLSHSGIPAFDINASCLGFLAAFDTISWVVRAGRYRRVLIVASDIASCGLDWGVLESSAIFGDGAAAAVIGPAGEGSGSCILNAGFSTYSSGVGMCKIPAGGSRYHPSRIDEPFIPLTTFQMDGKNLFRLTLKHLPDFIDQLLSGAGTTRDRINWVIPHQASNLALSHATKRLGFEEEKVINIFSGYGNQVAASLPTALDIAIRDGRIRRGDRLLLIGTGAGLSMGGMVVDY